MKNNIYTAIPDWFNKVQSQSTDNTSTTTTQTTIIGGGGSISMSVHNLFIKSDTTITIDDFTISDLFVTDQITDTENWLTTPLLHTLPNTEVSVTTAAQQLYIGAYDKNNNQIKLYQFSEAISTVVIPENCYYLRASSNKTNTDLTIKYVGLNNFDETQQNKLESSSFQNFLTLVEGDEKGIITNSVQNLSLVFQNPLYYTLDKAGNVLISIDRDALFSQSENPTDDRYVTTVADSVQDILSSKNFKEGLSINGIEIVERNGFLYIKGNLATTGGITAYTDDPDDPGSGGGLPGGGAIGDIVITGSGNALVDASLSEDHSVITFTKDWLVDAESDQSITGIKDFINGIKLDGQLIKIVDGVLFLDCSIAATGGITAYATMPGEGSSSIMDQLVVDTEYFIITEEGVLTIVPGSLGGISNIYVTGNGNALTTATLSEDGKTISFTKDKTFADDTEIKRIISEFKDEVNEQLKRFVTLDTEQEITAIKHFIEGVTIGSNKHRFYEKDGVLWLEGDLAVTGGITAYSTGDGSGGSGGGLDTDLLWELLAGSGDQQINKTHLTTALSGYATENWITNQNYAVKSTTLAGYGITDAYTKTDSDNRYVNVSGDTMTGNLYFNSSDYPFFNKSNSYAFYNVAVNLESWSNNYFYPVKVTSNTPTFPLCTISISSTSGSASLPLNNNSIRFMVRSGGWSDIGKRLIVLDHWAYSSSEITIYAIYLGEEDGDCVVYLRGGVNYMISISGRDWVSSSDSMLINGNERYPKIDLSGNPTDGRSFAKCYRAWTHADGYGVGLNAEYADNSRSTEIVNIASETGSLTGTSLPSNVGLQVFSYYNSGNGPTDLGNFLRIRGNGGGCAELFLGWQYDNNTNYIWYKSKRDVGSWGSWRQVAFTDMNVASATKLQTARTLWGRSFDGTGNVSGEISTCTRLRNSNESPLYLGNSNNASWVYTQDIASHNGVENWAIGITGTAWFKNVNIGYAHPATGNHPLNVNGVISGYAYTGRKIRIECDNAGNNLEARASEINNYNSKLYLQHDTSQDLICCNGGGKVGIGAASPQYKLHVSGTIFSNSEVKCVRYVYDGITQTGLSAANYFLDSQPVIRHANEIASVPKGSCRPIIRWGDVMSGIGYNTRYLIASVRDDSYGWGRIFMAVSNNDAGTSVGCTFSIYGSGYVEVTGNILSTGGITAYSSDIRAKNIIENIELSLKQISEAPTVRFKWNGWKLEDDGKTHIGGLAQYTQKVLPEAVLNTNDFLNMDYATTGYIFAVHTARHLLDYETKTDKEIRKLKNRIKYLEKQLKSLYYEEANIVDN